MIPLLALGDSQELEIDLTWPLGGDAFEPGEDWTLIWTLKASADDADAAAKIQKATSAGITVADSTATIELVPQDSSSLAAGRYAYDVQAQHTTTGEVRTVAFGKLEFFRDVTRLTQTSIPIRHTAAPYPSDILSAIDAADSMSPVSGSAEVPVSLSGGLLKVTLTAIKSWVLSGLEIAWGSVTGKPSTFAPSAHKSSHAEGGSDPLSPSDIKALGLVQGSYVIVQLGATDLVNAANLRTAYTAAAALTPGGNALSATNRATVILPPGKYDVAATTFELSTAFVDLVALSPQMGGIPRSTDIDKSDGTTAITQFRPPHTLIYSTTDDTVVVRQSVVANLRGFGIAQLSTGTAGAYAALEITGSTTDNRSRYEQMYFWVRAPHDAGGTGSRRYPVKYVGAAYDTWISCIANAYSWRHSFSGFWSCTMIDCYAGAFAYIGDLAGSASLSTAKFIRCKAVGQYVLGANPALGSGFGAFAGCLIYGVPVYGSEFVECEAGDQSFGIGVENSGTYIRCRGGKNCFGGSLTDGYEGFLSGYAEDCIGDAGSFGGRLSGVTVGYLSGTLVRCIVTGNVESIRLQSATIRDCRIVAATSGKDGVTLLDNGSTIINSNIEVNEAGAGAPVNAASTKTVRISGCYLNNGANHANGIGSNVINQSTNPLNSVKGASSIPLSNPTFTVSAKTTVVDADEALFRDSEASGLTKRVTLTNLWVWIKSKIESVALTLTSITITNYTESPVLIGNSGTSQTLFLTNGTFQTVTLTGNCTFTMPTATAGKSFILKVRTGAGGFTGTFTGVKWPGAVTPTITAAASKYDLISFVADGAAWSGSILPNYTA